MSSYDTYYIKTDTILYPSKWIVKFRMNIVSLSPNQLFVNAMLRSTFKNTTSFMFILLLLSCAESEMKCNPGELLETDYYSILSDNDVTYIFNDSRDTLKSCNGDFSDLIIEDNDLMVYEVSLARSMNCNNCAFADNFVNPYCEMPFTEMEGDFNITKTTWDFGFAFDSQGIYHPTCKYLTTPEIIRMTATYNSTSNEMIFSGRFEIGESGSITYNMELDSTTQSLSGFRWGELPIVPPYHVFALRWKIIDILSLEGEPGADFKYSIQKNKMHWYNSDSTQGLVFYARN